MRFSDFQNELDAVIDRNRLRLTAGGQGLTWDGEGWDGTDEDWEYLNDYGPEIADRLKEREAVGAPAAPAPASPNQPQPPAATLPRRSNDVFIEREEGRREWRSGGSRAWRNNNPGNIRGGQFAEAHGAVGSAGGFAVFPDYATGREAVKSLLGTPNYQNLTVNEAIGRYAPPSENDTGRYQQLIEQFTGLPGNTPMNTLTEEQLERVADAIERIEGWKEGTVTYEQQGTEPEMESGEPSDVPLS
ncbi:MAG: hypothetical protein AB1405_03265 [Bdellovibrionota bacterium]